MKIVTYKIRSYIKIVQSVSFDTNKLTICEISMKFLAFIKQKQNKTTKQ